MSSGCRFFLVFTMACAWTSLSLPTLAFIVVPPTQRIFEFHNTRFDHYAAVLEPEAQAIRQGHAGSDWVETGLAFDVLLAGRGVCRFANITNGSHFLTSDPLECATLRSAGSGWLFEGTPFAVRATNDCAYADPVYRLFNQRVADPNHRYTADPYIRDRMIERGWKYEGIAFCAESSFDRLALRFTFQAFPQVPRIETAAECEDTNRITLSAYGPRVFCTAASNSPPPSIVRRYATYEEAPPDFANVTGIPARDLVTVSEGTPEVAAQQNFVQLMFSAIGLHLTTLQHGPSAYTAMNPLYQFITSPAPYNNFRDAERVFPWRIAMPSEDDVQLVISFELFVKTLLAEPGSHVYGHPIIDFVDQRSGRHVQFGAVAYGTTGTGDYLGRDESGRIIVATSFLPQTRYGRSAGLSFLPTPSGFASPHGWGWGGAFEFRIDRTEFLRIIDDARTLDASLSSDPNDYFLSHFRFNNEVFGSGRVGLNLRNFELQRVRR